MADYLGMYSGPAIDAILTNSKDNTYRKPDVDRLLNNVNNTVQDIQNNTYTKEEVDDKLEDTHIEPCSESDIDSLFTASR